MVLQKLKADAEGYLGEKVTEAVITVPAYFNDEMCIGDRDDGMSFEAVCEYIDSKYNKLHIMLAGIGMGNDACMTKAVSEDVYKRQLLLQRRKRQRARQ